MSGARLKATPKEASDLSPEKRRTLQFLLDHWPKHQDILNSKPIPQHGIPSGFFSTSYTLFSTDELPTEDHWTWRQSNAKVAVTLDATTTVVMQKLNTRANKTQSTDASLVRPSYKLWNLRVIQTSSSFTFLYCEKGVEEMKTAPDSSSIKEESITEDSLRKQASASDAGDPGADDLSEGFCESSNIFGRSHLDADGSARSADLSQPKLSETCQSRTPPNT